MKKIFFVLLMISNWVINAQLVVDNTTQTPLQLAQNVLLGQGINISNIKFNGSSANANAINDQIGQFSNGSTTNIGINNGLILSTGNAIIAKGPNDRSLATLPTSNTFEGDADLSILTNNQIIKNVAILEFDFIPVGNKLTFNFVFASDEYPEFVNDSYNDNFGFFMSGPGITGPFTGSAQNIALIPSTTLPVSINNLNNGNANAGPCEYCAYYVNNEGGTSIQYDGFTGLLAANADVQCGQTYHIKLAIANVGDNLYDSAVFIEGASFSSPGINLGEDIKICSTTNYTLKTGLNPSIIHEWTYNGAVIPFETGPQIIVNQSGTYGVKATPIGIGCPVSDDIKIQFGTIASPSLYCGTKTSNSITFDWLALGSAEFSVEYKIGNNTPVNVGFVGKVYSYTVPNVAPGETVLIIVTPIGTPAECFGPNSISCILDTCITTPTLSLKQGAVSQQICEKTAISDIILTIGGDATNASITAGSLPAGLTTSLVGNTFTIKGIATVSGIFNYTISTSGGCGASVNINGSITVTQKTTPTFTPITPICIGETLPALPVLSNNSILGIWSPALNNVITTEYTFTPDTGQCATTTKLTINVNPKTTPTFAAIDPICIGETLTALPLLSNNSISGIWAPAFNNLITTEYTFTPDTDQCANTIKLTINVNPKTTPTFNPINPICSGETLSALPLLSNNSISGIWAPALNNMITTEYTFTPNAGQCANTTKFTIPVNPKVIPTFTPIAPICSGETLAALPLVSNNSISGTWSPILNNSATSEYTFIPDAAQCSNTGKLTITIHSKPIPLLDNGMICIDKNTKAVIQSYTLDSRLNNADYNFKWFLNRNPINNSISSTLKTSEKGTYSVIATNKTTNCSSSVTEATVIETFSNSATFDIIQTTSFNNDATITIQILQGNGNYEYQLDNGTFQTSTIFSEVSAGTHTINIRDTSGCTNLSKKIIVLGYPKFFTPNGDGYNDTWNIIGFEPQSNPVIYIFDRYGKLLKQINSAVLGWDGSYNGYPLPSTDYWFKVNFTENGITKEFKSHFALKR
ncbi:T9SS type B sorting domain-containing protein [Flavobacterium sp. N3904]|uniref:T9SS type B sorting domain-containing protein n=1 Tax=Flavobacterium sp. N3904 TaxID=2986835 RepID=UPI002223F0FF|nr:T9SS type B sorting domain-containing protein [Flavobacterium sp. N3904]